MKRDESRRLKRVVCERMRSGLNTDVPASRSVGAREARLAKEKKREAKRRWDMVRRAALRLHGHQLRRCLRSWLLVVGAERKLKTSV